MGHHYDAFFRGGEPEEWVVAVCETGWLIHWTVVIIPHGLGRLKRPKKHNSLAGVDRSAHWAFCIDCNIFCLPLCFELLLQRMLRIDLSRDVTTWLFILFFTVSVLGLSQSSPQMHIVRLGLLVLWLWPRLLLLLHSPPWVQDQALALPRRDQVVHHKNSDFGRIRKLAAGEKPS